MSRASNPAACDFSKSLLECWMGNDEANQTLLRSLEWRAWTAKPPSGTGRTIQAIFSHVHNARCKWLRLSSPQIAVPSRLPRAGPSRAEAAKALSATSTLCAEMFARLLHGCDDPAQLFHRDGWARPWQPGAAMVVYAITHEAHHRGQVCLLAHALGFRLGHAGNEIWMWEKLWKRCGFGVPR